MYCPNIKQLLNVSQVKPQKVEYTYTRFWEDGGNEASKKYFTIPICVY